VVARADESVLPVEPAPGGRRRHAGGGRAAGRVAFAALTLTPEALAGIGVSEALGINLWAGRTPRRFRAAAEIRAHICRSIDLTTARLGAGPLPALPAEGLRRALVWPFVLGIAGASDTASATVPGASLVRQVEDWVAGQHGEAVHVLDICRALNVPVRTLQRAFHQELGMGPARYLTLRRLASARASLLTAGPRATSVTDVALDHGFWELGRFAGTYRRIYGENPSQTLHRAAQQ